MSYLIEGMDYECRDEHVLTSKDDLNYFTSWKLIFPCQKHQNSINLMQQWVFKIFTSSMFSVHMHKACSQIQGTKHFEFLHKAQDFSLSFFDIYKCVRKLNSMAWKLEWKLKLLISSQLFRLQIGKCILLYVYIFTL